ncbi:MAG: PaaI family thioesterase [Crocinitomicaceae bacterium]|nr:PaaI family thioesterase [Crocinitomicaceae bacterium]
MDFSKIPIQEMNKMHKNTLMETLGIDFTHAGENFLVAKMPVTSSHHQPMGLLHGGATAALIETIGSMGSAMTCDLSKEAPVGLELNVNHIRGVKEGEVIGSGKLIHKGRSTHVWQVDVHTVEHLLIATGRLTVMIIQR